VHRSRASSPASAVRRLRWHSARVRCASIRAISCQGDRCVAYLTGEAAAVTVS
jgi:hypothetical protein